MGLGAPSPAGPPGSLCEVTRPTRRHPVLAQDGAGTPRPAVDRGLPHATRGSRGCADRTGLCRGMSGAQCWQGGAEGPREGLPCGAPLLFWTGQKGSTCSGPHRIQIQTRPGPCVDVMPRAADGAAVPGDTGPLGPLPGQTIWGHHAANMSRLRRPLGSRCGCQPCALHWPISGTASTCPAPLGRRWGRSSGTAGTDLPRACRRAPLLHYEQTPVCCHGPSSDRAN